MSDKTEKKEAQPEAPETTSAAPAPEKEAKQELQNTFSETEAKKAELASSVETNNQPEAKEQSTQTPETPSAEKTEEAPSASKTVEAPVAKPVTPKEVKEEQSKFSGLKEMMNKMGELAKKLGKIIESLRDTMAFSVGGALSALGFKDIAKYIGSDRMQLASALSAKKFTGIEKSEDTVNGLMDVYETRFDAKKTPKKKFFVDLADRVSKNDKYKNDEHTISYKELIEEAEKMADEQPEEKEEPKPEEKSEEGKKEEPKKEETT